MQSAPSHTAHASTERLPGEPGIWVFIFGDMIVFGVLFSTFMFYRGHDLELYRQSRLLLDQHFGAVATLLLLASSWLVVLAVSAARGQRMRAARTLLAGALICGASFAVGKLLEYSEKVGAGITLSTNEFFTFYYVLTGFHFLHLMIGMGVLVFLARLTHRDTLSDRETMWLEGGACFWHMVDLLWIVLYPLLYLLQ